MTREEILESVREVIRNHLLIHSPLAPETNLIRDLQLDSLQQLTLVVELENRFRICFDRGQEEGLETVEDVVRLISARLAEAGPGEGNPDV